MSKRKILFVLMIFALLLAACAQPAAEEPAPADPAEPAEPAEPAAPAVSELSILWAQWDPADYLQQIGNMYEAETGIKVNIVQEPWGSFQTRFFTEMAAGGEAWDMVVGDSQWLGDGSQNGHYMELTDFLNSTGIAGTVTPATLTYYGEYPDGFRSVLGLSHRGRRRWLGVPQGPLRGPG